jgi:molybdopterin/thiamine biosynthesis adenylyltransferase
VSLVLPTEIRVPAHLAAPLRDGIAWTPTRESVVFGLASHTTLQGRTLLLVQKLIPLPPEAYVAARHHGAKWPGAAMVPVLNEALAGPYGVIVFHGHPHAGAVFLSPDDRGTATRLLPTFQLLLPERPHALVVLGEDHAAGLVLQLEGEGYGQIERVRLLGQVVADLPQNMPSTLETREAEAFNRQGLLIGGPAQAKVRQVKVAVVGLSGGGSHVVQQLAFMGVAEIIGIDDGQAKRSHQARVIGIEPGDIRRRRLKIEIMERMVRRISRRVRFTGVSERIPTQPAIDALKEADIVVGCVDNYHARADIQELCSRFLVPFVDIGLLIRPIEGGTGVTIGGNVITTVPGRSCLWCLALLTQERLDAETGGRPRSYFEGADGQAQVVSMNGLLASQAATEVLQLITGFAPIVDEYVIKKYDGLAGTLQDWVVDPNPPCPRCRADLAAGDLVWRAA